VSHVAAGLSDLGKRIDRLHSKPLDALPSDLAVKALHPQARLSPFFQRQPLSWNSFNTQCLQGFVVHEFAAQNVAVQLQPLVASKLDEPMLPDVRVRQGSVGIQQAIRAFRHQQFGRFATRPCCAANRSPLLVGVLKKAVVTIDHVLAREAQRRMGIKPLKRLFNPQMAYRRRRAAAKQKQINAQVLRFFPPYLLDQDLLRSPGRGNVVQEGGSLFQNVRIPLNGHTSTHRAKKGAFNGLQVLHQVLLLVAKAARTIEPFIRLRKSQRHRVLPLTGTVELKG